MVNTKIRLITFFAAENNEALYVRKTILAAGCGSNHELLIAKLRLKLKKKKKKTIGKTTRSFRYDLNKILYYYTVDMTNRFKALYLVDREPEELWMDICNVVQEAVGILIPKEGKNARRQNGYLRRLYK